MTITICASVDFSPTIIKIMKDLELRGHKVNIPFFTNQILEGKITYEDYMKSKEAANADIHLREAEHVDFIKRYWNFIKESDSILVVNLPKKGINGYIGGSTLFEMAFAYVNDKKIYLYHPIPERSERIHYVDEIIEFHPLVINEDLSKIA
jgi:hypothetical protein